MLVPVLYIDPCFFTVFYILVFYFVNIMIIGE